MRRMLSQSYGKQTRSMVPSAAMERDDSLELQALSFWLGPWHQAWRRRWQRGGTRGT